MGEAANKTLVGEIANKISSSWNFTRELPQRPVVLMIGGFQGSGKTTVLDILRRDNELIVISPDQIRHELFARGVEFSEEFVHTVNAARNALLKLALLRKRNIAIDQFVNKERIDVIEKIVSEENKYRVIRVLLLADDKILEQRVRDRESIPETYRGTVGELKASIEKYGHPNPGLYDRVLDTQNLSPSEVAREIEKLLQV